MRSSLLIAALFFSCSGTVANPDGGSGGGGGAAGGGSGATGGGTSASGGGGTSAMGGGTSASGGGSGATGGGTSASGGGTSASGGGTSAMGGGTSAMGGGSGSTDGGYLPDPVVTGHVLEVCPSGCTYAIPSAAFMAAVDGDTIQVDYGDYTDCGTIAKNNIIIRGVSNASGMKPRMGGMTCGRKGIIIVQGANTLIENLELHDAVDPTENDRNWACVRFDTLQTAYNLKLRDCWLHDADDGVLGNNATMPAMPNNTVVFEGCLFEKLGREGYAHGMYLGTGVNLFVLRNSIVRNNHDDGHLVKSRAIANIIECNTIASLDGLNSFAIDLPQGGDATVRQNVVEQGPNINNGGDFFINFAEENGNNAPHSLTVHDNAFVNDYTAQGQINVAVAGAATNGWAANTYAGAGGSMTLTNYSGPNSFTNSASRAAAGLPPYDGTIGCLPVAPVCP